MLWTYFIKHPCGFRFLVSPRFVSSFSPPSSSNLNRALEPLPQDEVAKRLEQFEPPPDSKLARTVIIGCPNAGKSVLTNALIGSPVSAVSNKVHTTRKSTRGACMLDDRTQLLVIDTPGVVTSTRAKKHHLEDSFLADPEGAMLGANTVCVLLDAADKRTREKLDPRLLHLLYRHRYRMTSILVLTKVDVAKSRSILLELATKLTKGIVGGGELRVKKETSLLAMGGEERMENMKMENGQDSTGSESDLRSVDATLEKYWTGVNWNLINSIADAPWPQMQESMLQKCYRDEVGWPLFDRVFMLSALKGEGVDELRSYLNKRATLGKWRYHPNVMTDQDPKELVKDVVRSKLMDRLKHHIPYTLDFKICVWEVNENDVLCIRMDVLTRQERDAKFIIGPRGTTVGEVAQDVNQVLRNLFQREVFFRLGVYTARR